MPVPIKFIPILLLAALALTQTEQADAQLRYSRQPLQAPMRWLGQGWSTGYHWQNPGPNSDYYNPYTAHNSYLVSKQPGYHVNGHQYQGQQMMPGVPYSVYAPTSNSGGSAGVNWNYGHGQSIEPSFEVSDTNDDQDEADNEEESADSDAATDESGDDMPNVSSDPNEPGSILSDEANNTEAEDADFEEASTEEGEETEADSNMEATNASFRSTPTESDNQLDFSRFLTD